jgi:uncharacterized protein YegL
MRRLPVYFLLDTSGSMYGTSIVALNNSLSEMIGTLRQDPQAIESVWISIITFDITAKEIIPLSSLDSFQLPEITCPRSGPTHTGEALSLLHSKVISDIKKGSATEKGDWKPLLFLFTDGSPSDKKLYRDITPQIKALNFGIIVGCAAGALSDDAMLKEICDHVVHLDTADASTLKQFFKWVSETIDHGNKSMGTGEKVGIPPPPTDINLVI